MNSDEDICEIEINGKIIPYENNSSDSCSGWIDDYRFYIDNVVIDDNDLKEILNEFCDSNYPAYTILSFGNNPKIPKVTKKYNLKITNISCSHDNPYTHIHYYFFNINTNLIYKSYTNHRHSRKESCSCNFLFYEEYDGKYKVNIKKLNLYNMIIKLQKRYKKRKRKTICNALSEHIIPDLANIIYSYC